MNLNLNRFHTNKILVFLILIDILFCLIHFILGVLTIYGFINVFEEFPNWLITADLSYSESFQYLKFCIILIILFEYVFIKKDYIFFPWLILFGILLIDDSFQVHEKFGVFISENFNFKGILGLGGRDLGELCYAAFLGILFFSSLFFSLKNSTIAYKKTSLELTFLILILVFFGIFIDMFHAISPNQVISGILGLIEDGGEMISVSLIVWYMFLIRNKKNRNENQFYNKIFSPLSNNISFNP